MKFGFGRNDTAQVLNGIKSQWIELDKTVFQYHSNQIKTFGALILGMMAGQDNLLSTLLVR